MPGKRLGARIHREAAGDENLIVAECARLANFNKRLGEMLNARLDECKARGQLPDEHMLGLAEFYRTTALGLASEQRIREINDAKIRKMFGQDPVPVLTSEEAENEAKELAVEVLKQLPPEARDALVAKATGGKP